MKILVIEQNGSSRSKVAGIRKYGGASFDLKIISIDAHLPVIIDNTDSYLPQNIRAELVLDFLKHPDLSEDLAHLCRRLQIPLVASGKKHLAGVHCPPT